MSRIVEAVHSALPPPTSAPRTEPFADGKVAVVAVAVFALALSLFGTHRIPLIDRDEGRYAEAAREMFVSGDWLVPRLFAVPYLEKPPLFYWLTAISYGAVGVNEAGARMVSALSGALGVLATGLFARHVFGGRAGLFAATVLATSGLHLVLARVAITDMLFAALLGGALIAFYVAETEGRSFLLFWFLAAGATLTKGPVAPVVCALVGCAHLALVERWRVLRSGRFWLGFPVFLAAVLPWFVAVEVRHPGFLGFYVYKEHLLRVAGDEHREPFYWYAPWILAALLPWTIVAAGVLPAMRDRLRERSSAGDGARFAATWAAVVFVFFSIPRGKLVPYILPVLPPLAMVVGDALARRSHGSVGSRAVPRLFSAIGAAFIVAPAALPIVLRASPVAIPVPIVTLCATGAVVAGALTIAAARADGWKPVAALAGAVAALELVAVWVATPIAAYTTVRPVVERLRAELAPGDEVALYSGYFPNVPFYLGRIPYYVFGNRELDFGMSIDGPGPWLLPDLAALESRVGARRVLIVLKSRERDFRDLAKMRGETEILYRGRSSSLVVHRPNR